MKIVYSRALVAELGPEAAKLHIDLCCFGARKCQRNKYQLQIWTNFIPFASTFLFVMTAY